MSIKQAQKPTLEQLQNKLIVARTKVQEGGLYYHYRSPEKLYKVLSLGIDTQSEEVTVIYQSVDAPYTVWTRSLDSWLSFVEEDNRKVARFARFQAS